MNVNVVRIHNLSSEGSNFVGYFDVIIDRNIRLNDIKLYNDEGNFRIRSNTQHGRNGAWYDCYSIVSDDVYDVIKDAIVGAYTRSLARDIAGDLVRVADALTNEREGERLAGEDIISLDGDDIIIN